MPLNPQVAQDRREAEELLAWVKQIDPMTIAETIVRLPPARRRAFMVKLARFGKALDREIARRDALRTRDTRRA